MKWPKKLRRIFHLKRLENERGSLLIISYFGIVVLLGIAATLLTLTSVESLVAERQRLTTLAFHIAEAGIERGLYDLRQDFVNDSTSPSWADGDINSYAIGPNTGAYYNVPYSSTAFSDGTYSVQLKNVAGADDIWLKSVGTVSGVSHTIEVYVRMIDVSPWNNVIFAGGGASGLMINGNVNIRGSVHILGTNLDDGDYAVDLGGTAEIVGNNYNGVSAALVALVPPLPTTTHNGETVSTLNSILRVKKGIVGVSGSATVGEPNVAGNGVKESVNAVYNNDGFGGNQGVGGVYSDNGHSTGYDLGDAVEMPSLSSPYAGYPTYQAYLKANALVLTTELSNVTPGSSFSYSNAKGSVSMSGGNMTISGIVYVDGGNNLALNKNGANKTITYSGKGSILVTGNASVNVNLLTTGNNSFPTNVIGIMTPNNIDFNEASIDVMGAFYAETQVRVQKQTDIMGTIVSNYFDMGTNVPSIFQVPALADNLPPGMISSNVRWYIVVAWIKT